PSGPLSLGYRLENAPSDEHSSASCRGRQDGKATGCNPVYARVRFPPSTLIVMGTLRGSPNPPAMGSREQSSRSPDAILFCFDGGATGAQGVFGCMLARQVRGAGSNPAGRSSSVEGNMRGIKMLHR